MGSTPFTLCSPIPRLALLTLPLAVLPSLPRFSPSVVTFLPACSALSYEDVSMAAAEAFDITSPQYLQVPWGMLRYHAWLSQGAFSMGAGRVPHLASWAWDVGAALQAQALFHRPAPPARLPRPPQKLVPTVVPGIILGIMCLLGFIFFMLWM